MDEQPNLNTNHVPTNDHNYENDNVQNAPPVLYEISENGDLIPYTFVSAGASSSQNDSPQSSRIDTP